MKKATYVLAKDEISDLVLTSTELMRKFRHGLPRGTEIYGSDHINIHELEIPRIIRLEHPTRTLKLPSTKLGGLYRLVK